MKTWIMVVSLLVVTIGYSQAAPKAAQKMLVTYFTFPEQDGIDASSGASRVVVNGKMYGATEHVARVIADVTGADLFQIKTQHTYPNTTHKELIEYAQKEAEARRYPKMMGKINRFSDYDLIFVGYPNWWYDMPMVIYTLFNNYDFGGKTIIPFCTHGGSGFSESVERIKELEKRAIVTPMTAISRNNVSGSRKGVENWLKNHGLARR